MLDLFRNVDSAAILQEALYCYCENNTSLTRSYKPGRLALNKYFYQKCIELCRQYNYPPIVLKSCRSPFLGNVIGTLKQAVQYSDTMHEALHQIRVIVDDPMVQEAVLAKQGGPIRRNIRILFWSIHRKQYLLTYALVKMKAVRK